MEFISAFVISAIYFDGFCVAYIKFRPKDDSWRGWIIDAVVSLFWFITLPLEKIMR